MAPRPAAGTGWLLSSEPPAAAAGAALLLVSANSFAQNAPGDELSVTASFTVWRFRAGRSSCYVGRYRYRLRQHDGSFRIALKRAELDMTDLNAVAEVAIIL